MYIEWKDAYSIGVPRLDEQHRQLIQMLNDLYQKIGPDTAPGNVWGLLDGFNRYAETHFIYEERIAGDAGVPQGELNLHKREHEAYRERMRTFQHAFSENDKRAPVQLMAFLSNWWLSHILVSDMELGRLVCQAQQDGNG